MQSSIGLETNHCSFGNHYVVQDWYLKADPIISWAVLEEIEFFPSHLLKLCILLIANLIHVTKRTSMYKRIQISSFKMAD